MSSPTDGKVTDFPVLPPPVQGADTFYVIRNGADYQIDADALWTFFRLSTTTTTTIAPTTTTTLAPTTTAGP